MNKESFEKLPEEKKKIIEQAYFAAFKKEIAPGDFFTVCRKTLTEAEYASLFNERARSAAAQAATARPPPEPAEMEAHAQRDQGREEIKTEHIEDIIQYSGIDLKEEAENIVKEAEYHVTAGTHDDVDFNSQVDSLFNVPLFKEFVGKLCAARNVRINDDGAKLLFQVMKRKLLDFTERLEEACKIRTEAGLGGYSFQIDNEASKQLWYLNELERARMDKLMIKKDEDQKKKKIIQEREDLLIKKRQSNTVAMAAMGLKQRSWMSTDPNKASDDASKFSSIYAPFDERAFDDKIKERVITMKDLIYVLEKDKRYNKSVFLIQHYFK